MMTSSRYFFFSLAAALLCGMTAAKAADDKKMATDAIVWSGLFYAGSTNGADEKGSLPEGLAADLVERMKKVERLRFDEYRLVGAVKQEVLKEYESWVLPSEVFFIKLDSLGRTDGGALAASLQVWQKQDVLMKATVSLLPGRPIFVRGPKWGEGYIVIALLLR